MSDLIRLARFPVHLSLWLLLLCGCATQPRVSYPATRMTNQVDVYHGVAVSDPYRWLEDDHSPETKAWVEAENKVTFDFLNRIPQRELIRQRLTRLWDYKRYGVPFKKGGRYFFTRQDGLQNQSVLYTMTSLDAEPVVLLDPNQLSPDGTVALADVAISDDGNLMAYGLSRAGSDWTEWKVRDVRTGEDLSDDLKWVKFSGASWTKDGKGFFYSRYDEPAAATKMTAKNCYQKLYYHRQGTPQSADQLVYHRPDRKDWVFSGTVTEDGHCLIITVGEGDDPRTRVYYRDLTQPDAPVIELLNDFDAKYVFVDNNGPVFWFHTDLDAPRGRVIAVDITRPQRTNWREIIPQAGETLREVNALNDSFVCAYLKDAGSRIRVFSLDGRFRHEIAVPGAGTVSGFGGKREDRETFYSFTSFTVPGTIYRHDLTTGVSTVFRASRVDFNPAEFETRQIFYASKDGTRVPMFITCRKGIKLDGCNPTLLYGYGGFDISITPSFSVANLLWMEMGGVYAVANLRGGGEYGEAWHRAGRKLHKQNVFDDFIAAAEWLCGRKPGGAAPGQPSVASATTGRRPTPDGAPARQLDPPERYTGPRRLAIMGRSNGGLLVAACETQRPDLFGACLPAVGVMDMLRFHQFTIGWAWTSDYGSSENPDEFKALYAYSPLHLIRPGTKYPATLITTADHDDRVVPAHSFKFAAALQAAQAGPASVLIRIDTKAGHGAGKPTSKLIAEVTDQWAFLARALQMKLPPQFGQGGEAATKSSSSSFSFPVRRGHDEGGSSSDFISKTSLRSASARQAGTMRTRTKDLHGRRTCWAVAAQGAAR